MRNVEISLWLEDAIVLFDWISRVDMERLPAVDPAVKQALTDLLTRLEESVPGELSEERVEDARREVAKDMGW